MAKRKFYAVVKGRTPGLYDEWFGENGALAQVDGMGKSVYKSFATLREAEAWFTEIAGKAAEVRVLSKPVLPEDEKPHSHQEALAAGKVVIYSDGGCIHNPGQGGYGVVLLYREQRKELAAAYTLTTNNRMELMGCIAGLSALKQKRAVVLYTDSSYVVDGIQKGWATRWRANNWTRMEEGVVKPAKNADLWQRLLALCELHEVELVWVRGHAGVKENERCHDLCAQAIHSGICLQDEGFNN